MSVGVRRIFESVCLFVCPRPNSETIDPKLFKLGVGVILGHPGSGTKMTRPKGAGSTTALFPEYISFPRLPIRVLHVVHYVGGVAQWKNVGL